MSCLSRFDGCIVLHEILRLLTYGCCTSRDLDQSAVTNVYLDPPLSSRTDTAVISNECERSKNLRTGADRHKSRTAIVLIAPGQTLAINRGPFMGMLIFRKRERVSERSELRER